jgi:mannose-6-phosphate isomerase-like protein (cupin superfamily)
MTGTSPRSTVPDATTPLREVPIGSTSSTFAVAEYLEPPGIGPSPRTLAPLHRHRAEDEAWYVLAGELAVRLDDREVRATAGAAVWSRPNVAHTFWNPSPAPVRYLLIMGPNTHEFVDTLHRDPPTGAKALHRLAERCGIELLE